MNIVCYMILYTMMLWTILIALISNMIKLSFLIMHFSFWKVNAFLTQITNNLSYHGYRAF